MRKTLLKSVVAIITFAVGIFAVADWIIYPFSLTQNIGVQSPDAVKTDDDEEYLVYSAVLENAFVKNKSALKPLVISNKTFFYADDHLSGNISHEQRIQHHREYFSSVGVGEETLADYESKELRSYKIRPKFDLPLEYIIVDAEKMKDADNYAAARLIRLSKVGFNRERNQAFVTVNYICPLCGFQYYVLLEKENGDWKIKDKFDGYRS